LEKAPIILSDFERKKIGDLKDGDFCCRLAIYSF
jgi:hypothetical protein